MAKGFNLTARINLAGPTNLKPIVAEIKRELGTIQSNVQIKLDARSTKSIGAVTNRLKAMNEVLVAAKSNTDSLNASLATLSSSLASVSNSGGKVSVSIRNTASGAAEAAKNIKQASTEMQEFGKQAYLAIRRFAAFSIVSTTVFKLVNAVNSGIAAFVNFDKELVKLQQVTGQGATGLKFLEKTITQLSTSLGVSSESLINVASTLAQAGLNAEETRIALSALAKTELAPSFDNLTETTEGAIAALRQFELQAGDLESALGSINAVAAAFAVESRDIITAIQRTGGVFAASSKGVSQGKDALNEFIAVFTSVRQTTRESAETIATGLRTIFTRIQRGSTIQALKDFGITLTDLEGKFVGPFEAIKRLSEGLKSLDPRDLRFSQIVEELGGFRQIGKVIPLIQQFAVAQKALGIAQTGQTSLTDAQIIAQQSLANQIAKVREQFLALFRDIGQTKTFQVITRGILGLTSAFLSLASAFKPILPVLAVLGTIKGVKALGEFGTGFFGGFKRGGGARAAGSNIGGALTGTSEKEKSDVTVKASETIRENTSAIKSLTNAINSLATVIDSKSTGFNNGGIVGKFATGGVVPGSGNRDTIPAMLTPGEFVIRKKAVEKIGVENLARMNSGGRVQKFVDGGEIEKEILSNTIQNTAEGQKRYQFGLVGLRSGTKESQSRTESFTVNTGGINKAVDLHIRTLSETFNKTFSKKIEKHITGQLKTIITNTADNLRSKLGGQKLTAQTQKEILSGSTLSSAVGSIFESSLGLLGSPYVEKTEKTKAIDFPKGLGVVANKFNISPNIPTDVTRTVGGRGKGLSDMKGQIKRFLKAIDRNEFTKAANKLAGKKAMAQLNKRNILSNIFDKIPPSFNKSEAGRKLKEKYGLRQRGALNPKSLPTTLETLSEQGQEKQFLADLRSEIGLFPKLEILRQHNGGKTKGFSSGRSSEDTVHALLTPGEFVVNKKAAKRIGYSRLNRMNKADKLQGFNKGGAVGNIQKFAGGGLTKDEQDFIDYRARQAGTSTKAFSYDIAGDVARTATGLQRDYSGRKQEFKYSMTQEREKLKGLDLKTVGGQNAFAEAVAEMAKKVQSFNPEMTFDEAKKAAEQLAKGLLDGKKSNDELIQENTTLKTIMDKELTATEALTQARIQVAKQQNIEVGILDKVIDPSEIKRQQFIQSEEGKRFGNFSLLAPDMAKKFSESGTGGALMRGSDFLAGKGGRLSKLVGGMGGIGGIGAALAVGSEGLKSLLPKSITTNANVSGAFGAISGAGAGAATGAMLGAQIAGPVGAMVAGIGGAVIGGIQGFFDAKNTQILTNALESVAKSSSVLDTAFKKLAADSSNINFEATQKAFGDVVSSQKDIIDLSMAQSATLTGAATGGSALVGAGAGALIGSFFGPGIGTAIGAGVGYLGGAILDYRSKPSESVRKEAMQSRITQASTDQQTASRLAETQLKKTSTAELDQIFKSLKDGTSSLDPITKQYVDSTVKSAEATGKYTKAQLDSIAASTEEESYRQAYIKSLKESGASNDEVQRQLTENNDKVIAEGKKISQANALLLSKQEILARITKEVAVATENLLDVYERINAALTRFSSNADGIIANVENIINPTKISKINRNKTEEAILNNPLGFKPEEVTNAIDSMVNKLGGGEKAIELGQQAKVSSVLQRQLPALMRNPGATTEQVTNLARSQLTAILGEKNPIIGTIISEIENKLGQDKEGGLATLASEIESSGLGQISATAAKGFETLKESAKTYNDTLDKSIELENQWVQSMGNMVESNRKANQIRVQSELDLRRTLGQQISLQELNKPFESDIRGLTGGPIDVSKIVDQRQQALEEGNRLQAEREGLIANKASQDDLKKNSEALRKNKLRIDSFDKALSALANTADRANNALTKIGERQQRVQSFGEGFRGLFTGGVENRIEAMRQFSAVSAGKQALASGQTEIFGNQMFLQSFEQGLDRLKNIMDPTQYKDLILKSNIAMAEGAGFNVDEVMKGLEDTFGPQYNTLRKVFDLQAGKAAEGDPLIAEFKKYAEEQRKANIEIAIQQAEISNILTKEGINPLIKSLEENFPRIIQDAFDSARNNIQSAVQAAGNVAQAPGGVKGGVVYANSGGQLVNFKPKGPDRIPAMLADGEFVVNANATKNNLGLLEAINGGKKIIQNRYANKGGVIYAASGGMVSGLSPDTTIEEDKKKLNEEINAQGAAYAAGTSEDYKKDKAQYDSMMASYDEAKIREFYFSNSHLNMHDMAIEYAKSPYGAYIKNWNEIAKEKQEALLAGYRAKFEQFHDEFMKEAMKDPLFHNRFGAPASWPEYQKMREEAINQRREQYWKLNEHEKMMESKGSEDTTYNWDTKKNENTGTYYGSKKTPEQLAKEEDIRRREQLERDRKVIETGETSIGSGRLVIKDGKFEAVEWQPGEKEAAIAARKAEALANVNKARAAKGLPPLDLPSDQIDPEKARDKALRAQQMAQNRAAREQRRMESESVNNSRMTQANQQATLTPRQRAQQEKERRQQEFKDEKEHRKQAAMANNPALAAKIRREETKKQKEQIEAAQRFPNLNPTDAIKEYRREKREKVQKESARLDELNRLDKNLARAEDPYEPLTFDETLAVEMGVVESRAMEFKARARERNQRMEDEAEARRMENLVRSRAAGYPSQRPPSPVVEPRSESTVEKIKRQRAEREARDNAARSQINPLTGKPYLDAAEQAGVEAKARFEGKPVSALAATATKEKKDVVELEEEPSVSLRQRLEARISATQTTLRQLERDKKERQSSPFRSFSRLFGDNSEDLQYQQSKQELSLLQAQLDKLRSKPGNYAVAREVEDSFSGINRSIASSRGSKTREYRPGMLWGGETINERDSDIALRNANQGIDVTRDIGISAATALVPGGATATAGKSLLSTGARLFGYGVLGGSIAPGSQIAFNEMRRARGENINPEDEITLQNLGMQALFGGLGSIGGSALFGGLGKLKGKISPKTTNPRVQPQAYRQVRVGDKYVRVPDDIPIGREVEWADTMKYRTDPKLSRQFEEGIIAQEALEEAKLDKTVEEVMSRENISDIPYESFPSEFKPPRPIIVNENTPTAKTSAEIRTSKPAPKVSVKQAKGIEPLAPKITDISDPAQLGASIDYTTSRLAQYASSPEASARMISELPDKLKGNIAGVEIDPNLSIKDRLNQSGSVAVRGVRGRYNSRTKMLGFRTQQPDVPLIKHEIGHGIQDITGQMSPLGVAEFKTKLGTDIESFLQSKEGLDKLYADLGRKGYSKENIMKEPRELFTTLLQFEDTDAFRNNPMAQDMMKKIVRTMGYKNGGLVHAATGGKIGSGPDSILARVSPNEFIMNPQDSMKNLPLLHYMNRGGKISYFQDGGQTTSSGNAIRSAGPNGNVVMTQSANVTNNETIPDFTKFIDSFGTYVDRLEKIQFPKIPDRIELTGNYQLQVQIQGAAALESLDKRMKELAVSLIEPKLEELRNEVSAVTGGQVRNSAARGYKGDISVSKNVIGLG